MGEWETASVPHRWNALQMAAKGYQKCCFRDKDWVTKLFELLRVYKSQSFFMTETVVFLLLQFSVAQYILQRLS